jgi:hypothetical protein
MDMAKIQRKTVRKLVTLPVETAERVEQFRTKIGAASESDALKALIEAGLQRHDTTEGLFARCEAATANGQTIGEVINSVLNDHPLVAESIVDTTSLVVTLRTRSEGRSGYVRDERFRYAREEKKWFWEWHNSADGEWIEIKRKDTTRQSTRKGELDDDIPL